MLRRFFAVYWKEFMAYWNSPLGYIFLVLFLLLSWSAFFLLSGFFETNEAEMRSYFGMMPVFLYLLCPRPSACGFGRKNERKGRRNCS